MRGIDISNNNGDVNFDNIVKSGIDVVYIKSSEGATFQDIYRTINYNMAKERNLNVGFYHFLVATSTPEEQAKNFYSCIKDKEYNCLPCLDVEIYFNGVNNYVERFIKAFQKLRNEPILIYTYLNFGNVYLSDLFINNKFWLAHYTEKEWSYGDFKFPNVVGHQYTEKGRLINSDKVYDLNVFNKDILLDRNAVQNQNNVKIEGKVAELQGICNSILGTNLKIDNIYGSKTDEAVKKLPLLAYNRNNNKSLVQWVQLRLGVEPDGIYGVQTKLNVKYFQSRNNLDTDAIVGYNTYRKMATI